MKKTIIGGVVGGLILYIWGALAWTILPLHVPSLHTLPNEEAVTSLLRSTVTERGMYIFPAHPMTAADQDAWNEKFRRGPIGMLNLIPNGEDPNMPSQFIAGLIITLISGFLAAWFLSRSTAEGSSYVSRVVYCAMLGVFISFGSHLLAWNWLYYPMDYTTAMVADTIIGWILAGLGISAIVKVPRAATA